MAQTGYTPILIYSSSTGGNSPAAGNLTNSTLGSELAINITDGKLFYKDDANAVQVIGWKVVPATAGGTGQTSYTTGDLLYASSSTALSKLADVATGNALISGGVGVAPSWGKIGLTTHVSGTLGTANGGTGLSSFTANQVFYASSTSVVGQSANFTFNGNALTVKNSGTGGQYQAALSLQSTSSSYGAGIQFYDGTNDGYISWFGQALYFALTGGVTGASLTSNGWAVNNLIKASGTGTIGNANVFMDFTAPNGRIGSINSSGSPASNLLFATSTTGGTITTGMKLDYNQDLTISIGNIIQGTAAKGINFTANTAAAGMTSQLLNWYEEGTFDPRLSFATGGDTCSYSGRTGRYTRIGRLVTVNIYVGLTAKGAGTGNVTLINLPFTAGSYSSAVPRVVSMTSTGTVSAYIYSGQSVFTFFSVNTAGTETQITDTNITNSTEIVLTLSYIV